jgi:hypothetical protein
VIAGKVGDCYSFDPQEWTLRVPARRSRVWRREIDLQVGDVIQIGSQCVIVVDAQDDEVTLKICDAEDLDDHPPEWSGPSSRK